MMIIMTMMITIIIIIIMIIIIIINTFDAFEVNFLTIYKIDNVPKIWVEIKKAVEQENLYIGPSAFTWYDISLRLGV